MKRRLLRAGIVSTTVLTLVILSSGWHRWPLAFEVTEPEGVRRYFSDWPK